MSSLNQCNFIGNLGKDPEVRYMTSGNAVASIVIACSESWKDKTTGEKKEKTEWVTISAFGKLAEIMGEYLHKGSKVFISGKLSTDTYKDKNTGETKYSTKIIAEKMVMLSSRSESKPTQTAINAVDDMPVGDFSDDIPF